MVRRGLRTRGRAARVKGERSSGRQGGEATKNRHTLTIVLSLSHPLPQKGILEPRLTRFAVDARAPQTCRASGRHPTNHLVDWSRPRLIRSGANVEGLAAAANSSLRPSDKAKEEEVTPRSPRQSSHGECAAHVAGDVRSPEHGELEELLVEHRSTNDDLASRKHERSRAGSRDAAGERTDQLPVPDRLGRDPFVEEQPARHLDIAGGKPAPSKVNPDATNLVRGDPDHYRPGQPKRDPRAIDR